MTKFKIKFISVPNKQVWGNGGKKKQWWQENLRGTRLKREPICIWVTSENVIMNNVLSTARYSQVGLCSQELLSNL